MPGAVMLQDAYDLSHVFGGMSGHATAAELAVRYVSRDALLR